MEAFKVLEQMNRLTADADPAMQRQLKEIWNMLEEMSANSPEEYSKFVENQLKTGFQDMKKEEEAARPEVVLDVGGTIKIPTKQGFVLVNLCHSPK